MAIAPRAAVMISNARRSFSTLSSLALFISLGLGLGLGLGGCLDAPNISSANDGTQHGGASGSSGTNAAGGGGGSSASGQHDGMVLIPPVTLAGGVTPAGVDANNDNGKDGEDKGNGNGKGNKPPATPPTTPPATPPAGGGSAPPAPTATVAVASFWLDAREVTAGAYGACVEAGACAAPLAGQGCTLSEGLLDHPASCVSADQARAFCTWSGKRLVRNDEWTAAAAGNTARAYPWGATPPAADHLNACGTECAASGMYASSDGHVRTAPVGSFPLGRTPDGVDDLGGNVSEWVDGVLTPVARGGSYADVDATTVTSTTARVMSGPGPSIGFRCAVDL